MVARDNPRLSDGALSLDDLQEMPHAVAEFGAAGERKRPLEVEMERVGHRRPDRAGAGHLLLTLPFAVSGTEMCAFVPARLARRCLDILDLAIAETPLEPVQITEAAHWHPRRDNEPAVVWLRRLLYDVAVAVEDDERSADASRRLASKPTGGRGRSSPAPGTTADDSPPRPTRGATTAPRRELGEAEDRTPGTGDRRTSAIASAAELPMIAPLEATATKIATGSSPRRCAGARQPQEGQGPRQLDGDRGADHGAAAASGRRGGWPPSPAPIRPAAFTPKATP